MKTKRVVFLMLLTLMVSMILTTAAARELRFATGHPPNSAGHLAIETYAKFIKEQTNGEITVRAYPMSLLSYAETSDGVRDGIADIGVVAGPYFPSYFPRMNMLSDASMFQAFDERAINKEAYIYNGALAEFMFFHCPECHEEFTDHNQVFTGVASTSRYGLLCNSPMKSVSDFKNKRIRVAGPSWSRWVEYMGASPVYMPGNEMYEALNQGIITCASTSAAELINMRLMDVTKEVIMEVPGGVFAGSATQVNKDTWNRLTAQQKKSLIRGGAVYAADYSYRYQKTSEEAMKSSEKSGFNISSASEDIRKRTSEFIDADMATIAKYYSDRYGVNNAEEVLATFFPLLDKWADLVQGTNSSEELAEVYWKEVYSKVDLEVIGK